jgi:hypothetical protein
MILLKISSSRQNIRAHFYNLFASHLFALAEDPLPISLSYIRFLPTFKNSVKIRLHPDHLYCIFAQESMEMRFRRRPGQYGAHGGNEPHGRTEQLNL